FASVSARLLVFSCFCLFFCHSATTEIYTLSRHDALPIWGRLFNGVAVSGTAGRSRRLGCKCNRLDCCVNWFFSSGGCSRVAAEADRKSTRLNSSHVSISYAVFCLKKKKQRSRLDRARHIEDGETTHYQLADP